MPSKKRAGRRAPTQLGAILVAVGSLGALGARSDAYLLYDSGAFDYVVASVDAIRWSQHAWAPNSTLVWQIERTPEVDAEPDFAGNLVLASERALALWSDISTADISWQLDGFVSGSETSSLRDARNLLVFDRGFQGAAAWWRRNLALDSWEATECDVGLPFEPAELKTSDLAALDWLVDFLVRELGHCIGLGAPAAFPTYPWLRTSAPRASASKRSSAVWHHVPAMRWEAESLELAADDRVGASLLRPRAGWLVGTGSLSGTLSLDDNSVAYGHVWALRRNPEGIRTPVGAFADASGRFLIEGLLPGDYVLWAHPIGDYGTHSPLVENGAITEVRDTVLARPVNVSAGRVTDGISIVMRRGRE